MPKIDSFFVILLAGATGMAAAGTVTAAILFRTEGKGALYTVLTFPLLLPLFLTLIVDTRVILTQGFLEGTEWLFLWGYDGVLLLSSSLVFDYLWYD